MLKMFRIQPRRICQTVILAVVINVILVLWLTSSSGKPVLNRLKSVKNMAVKSVTSYKDQETEVFRSRETRKQKEQLPEHPYLLSIHQTETGTCTYKNCPAIEKDALNIHFLAHSHVDVGWRKTVDQYYIGTQLVSWAGKECVQCTLNTTITELIKNPKRRFIFAEMKYFSRFWKESDLHIRGKIVELIKSRQLEILNNGWVMTDAAITMYTDILDQQTLGFDWVRDTLGPCAQSRTAWHIDQFGHSREHASIFVQMGYDGLFIQRIDSQDLENRANQKNLEFMWDTSPNNYHPNSYLFTDVMKTGYYSPEFLLLDKLPANAYQDERDGNFNEVLNYLKKISNVYKTNNIMIPVGADFAYANAVQWYPKLDRIIDIINNRRPQAGERNMNAFYSTPTCYLKAVNEESGTLTVKKDDFLPYALDEGRYWTGFYTTRPGLKYHIKKLGQILQAAKQLSIFSKLENGYSKVNPVRDTMAVVQHHDAITGTQQKHVFNDYNLLLTEAIIQGHNVASDALQKLSGSSDKFTFCRALNESACPSTENDRSLQITLYNPLSWSVKSPVRLPVTSTILGINGPSGSTVPYQLIEIPEGIKAIPERRSLASSEALFIADLPPMSMTQFKLETLQLNAGVPQQFAASTKDEFIENEYLKLTFKSGLLAVMQNKITGKTEDVSQTFLYYHSNDKYPVSGHYVFIPKGTTTYNVQQGSVLVKVFKGPLVEEIHQQFSPWVSQVVRLYKGSRYAEFHWTVGPIPTADSHYGNEVITRFDTSIHNGDIYYSDSHGREILQRKRNFREGWTYKEKDPVSSNYYPVTSRIYIQDKQKDVQLTIMSDRVQGGASLKDGSLELMVHRATSRDDGYGLIQDLLDQGADNKLIRYTGRHFVCMESIETSVELTRKLALEFHFSPSLLFSKPVTGKVDPAKLKQLSFLSTRLPANLQVITLDYIKQDKPNLLLLRLEHFYEQSEHPKLSLPVTVNLQTLFEPFDIVTAEETTLGANFNPQDISRMQWNIPGGKTSPNIGSTDFKPKMAAPFQVTFKPMEIRTFRIQVDYNS